jgi:hypothetical protein
MAATPYLTSNDLIAAVQRKISMPISQSLFSATDILSFSNDEMELSLTPQVMSYHEEYFVFVQNIPLQNNRTRYEIPERALGMKLRDVKWMDQNNNMFDMTRIASEDKAYFQQNVGTSETLSKYYLESSDVVLTPFFTTPANISLLFFYFIRPNQLVVNERACIITAFLSTITTLNSAIVDGDTVTILGNVLTARTSPSLPTEFAIGASDSITATYLAVLINTLNIAMASNGTPSTATVSMTFPNILSSQSTTTSNSAGFVIPTSTQLIQFDQVPASYTDPVTFQVGPLFVPGATVDLLQTKGGHKHRAIDIVLPPNSISNTVIAFPSSSIPTDPNNLPIVGDYICLANECIIPQVPSDLHSGLAERTCARILAALGDQTGLQASMAKIADIQANEITLLDNRVESSPQKIIARNSILRYQSYGSRRRRL